MRPSSQAMPELICPSVDGALPWGVVRRPSKTNKIVGFEAAVKIPNDGLQPSLRSWDTDFKVGADRRVGLGRVDSVAEAIAMQTEFFDGLENQALAQELRR